MSELATQILPKTDPRSPFHSRIPQSSHPTEVLCKRFDLWRQIIRSMMVYFRAMAHSAQVQVDLNQNIANNSLQFGFFTDITKVVGRGDDNQYELIEPQDSNKQSFFSPFGKGSVQDMQILLKKYHINLAEQKKTEIKELNEYVGNLEALQLELGAKIKEIRMLNGDFKSDMSQQIALTGQLLNDYISVVSKLSTGDEVDVIDHKSDPFLKKYKLELQLRHQLAHERFLEHAFMNLQTTAVQLEGVVVKSIKDTLNKFSELISQEIFIHYNDLINEIHQGIISKADSYEWDEFLERDNGKNYLLVKSYEEPPKPKKLSDVKYPFDDAIFSKTIRKGFLQKKSKLMKSYSKSYYILGLNYLHEYKSDNVKDHLAPAHSIHLNDCIVVDSNETKFQLHVNSPHLMKPHNHVFKKTEDCSSADFKKWVSDIKNLTSFDNLYDRLEYVSSKLNGTPSARNSKAPTPRSASSVSIIPSMEEVNKKLQNLSLTSQEKTVVSLSNTFGSTSSNATSSSMRPSISIDTSSPPTQIPALNIVEATPAHNSKPPLLSVAGSRSRPPKAPLTPLRQEQFEDSQSAASSPVAATPQRPPLSRMSTPMIGEVHSNSETGPIDLSQKLYDDGGVDINDILKGRVVGLGQNVEK